MSLFTSMSLRPASFTSRPDFKFHDCDKMQLQSDS